MGKQTKQKGSHFGGEWTKQKLHIIDEYLKSYSTVLKNFKVKKIYVDGFAGSGKTELKVKDKPENSLLDEFYPAVETEEDNVIDGSALRSLQYNFDEYYFLELDEERIAALKENILAEYPDKLDKVRFINGDCNETLKSIVSQIDCYSRCFMFLDPYALELNWATLEVISRCPVIDLWYLFPISALNRVLAKNGNLADGSKRKITSMLGTDEWETTLYHESQQISLFGDVQVNRSDFTDLVKFVKERFATIFPYVSPDSKMLTNEAKNSPMFLLCFMMTNNSDKAQKLAAKLVKGIIRSTEKIK